MADRKGWIDDNMFIHELGFLIGNKEEQQKLDDALITPPVESVELREQVLTEFKNVLRLAPADYTENCTNVVMSHIQASQSELIDRLLAEMPKERKVPSFSLLSRSFKKVDVSMAFDGGYNRSLSEVKSILLKAKEGL